MSDTVIAALLGLLGTISLVTIPLAARGLWKIYRRVTEVLHAAQSASTQTTKSQDYSELIVKKLAGLERSVDALWHVTGIQEQLIEKSLPHREVLRQTYPHRQENNLL